MKFGLREKLALPLVASLIALTLTFHFYLKDRMLEDEKANYFKYQKNYLGAVEQVVSRLLLSGDLAELYATMNEYIEINDSWKQAAIFSHNGTKLYPLTELKSYSGKYIEKLEYVVTGDNKNIASINVWIDWEKENDEILEHVHELEIISLLIFLVMTIVSSLWLNKLIRSPIVELEDAAYKISQGDYDSTLPLASDDELGRLTRAFERMTNDIKEHEANLVVAKETAEKASNAKSLFLARVTHELRTPMNAILGLGQLLHSDTVNPLDEQHKALMEEMLNSGQHLLTLIDQVLELSKIESDEIIITPEPTSLNNTLHECITMSEIIANERNITFENKMIADINVLVDYQHFRDVILNILSNAIKYNRENGAISINREDTPHQVKIAITDQGEGINEKDIKKLFQPFERLGKENSDIRGIGMGLIISKRLLELMGGSIDIDSTPGEGTTIWITVNKA